MADDDKKGPRGRAPDASAADDEDSLEAIAARAMLDDDPPPAPRGSGKGAGAAMRPPPRRRVVTGAEAVDQILSAGAPKQSAPSQGNRTQAKKASGAKQPAAKPGQVRTQRAQPAAPKQAAPKPPELAPDATPTSVPEGDEGEVFEFEIPSPPRADSDARDLLIGGGSYEALDRRAETSERPAAPERPPEPEPAESAETAETAETGPADDFATASASEDEDLDGPGWDDSPFDPEREEDAAAEASELTDEPNEAEDAEQASSPKLAQPAQQAADGGKRTRDGDLLDPREAEGGHALAEEAKQDADAGRGERDLLSEQNLKEYLEALSAGAVQGEAPPASGAAAAGRGSAGSDDTDADGETAEAGGSGRPSDGNGDDGPDEGGGGREERGKSWSIKPSPGTKDDPLLGSLTILCTLLDRNISAEGLTAGLPLVDGMLTPELFMRAAQRAGVSARLVRRPLDGIGKLALPCVLLLDQQRACVLTHLKRSEGKATIILPEMGAGARDVDYQELTQDYVGYALFARPEFQYDQRAVETRVADPKGWFWGTIFGSWKLYVEVIIAAIMINAFVIANPLFVMNVYDRVVPNFAEETLWVLALGILIVYAFDFLLKLLRAYLVDVAGKTADTQIASRLFQQMLGMKMANRPPSAGGLANQLREFEHLREFFTSSTMTTLIDLPFIFLFLAIISVIGTWKIVIIPAFIVLVTIVVGMIMQIPMQRVVRETQRESQQKNAILIEAISGIETIKATGSEGRMQRAWETFVDKTARSAMLAHRWSSLAMTFSGTMMQSVTVAVVVVGVYEIQEGNMSVGALVACTILSGRALAPLSQIAGIATRFHQSRQALHGLDGMMKTPVERPEGRSFVTRPSFHGNIEFKNVAFTYPDAKTQALNDVSFKIEAGEKVGVIGRIGSGKSTLERLILGLYDADEGSVLIDGTDTRQVDPADLRRAIGVVPQDVYLFWGSVRENIALGAPYADDQTILRAARIAGVDEFIARHPLGLDMPVGERGMQLSGGQRQAISVARALLLDPPILVLDEPTSAMDNTTEARFKARLGTVLANKTLILVTHRGSLLSLVDRLIVMDGGRIVADGPKDIVMEALNAGRIQTART